MCILKFRFVPDSCRSHFDVEEKVLCYCNGLDRYCLGVCCGGDSYKNPFLFDLN